MTEKDLEIQRLRRWVEELEEKLDAAKRLRFPQWISAEDELPADGEYVLVTDGRSVWADYVELEEEDNGIRYHYWFVHDMSTNNTYWMSLPGPYKGAVDGND